MKAAEFRNALALLRWSQRGLAEALDTHPTTVRRWATGTQPIPDNVAAWLTDLATYAAQRRLPAGWRQEAA